MLGSNGVCCLETGFTIVLVIFFVVVIKYHDQMQLLEAIMCLGFWFQMEAGSSWWVRHGSRADTVSGEQS